MMVLRTAVRVHKWLALIIGIQVMIWILGGLVMSALPIERVRGEHNIARHAPLMADPADLKSVEEAAAIAGFDTLESAALTHLAGAPAWRLESAGRTIVIDAVTGARLSPVDEALARTIARHDFAPEAEIEAAQLLNDPPSEYGPGGEVWQIRFADADQTRLYIDPDTGVVRARRSDTWRVFDLFWRLHVMDYDDGADFNHPLLIISAALGLLVALAGLVILFIRMRRSWMIWRASRSV
ncbi:PepSY domain-containing protein [Oceanicaulis sp. MMSF_3324]|uniref:PepSY domain-containing protein n=1 Tax=Oceanicaulis sp. MMSF_3324 TaxID=3046702 RepID=UPI00273E43EB|nr:PepSY domain-containing protein [Oceanicaulis sp. MMSF_3324]